MAIPNQAQRTRQQVSGFVFIWTFITLIMGLATFLAIYFAYQPTIEPEQIIAANNNDGNGLVVFHLSV